jgi:hypothetical protein
MKGLLILLLFPAALLWADTAVSRIDAALDSGSITVDEAVLYLRHGDVPTSTG